MKTVAHARVQITLDIPVEGSWGGDCTLSQIEKQATDDAIAQVMRGVAINGLGIGHPHVDAVVVGKPKVTSVMVTKE